MSNSFVSVMNKPRLSVKAQTLATLSAIVGAVVIPQLFHVLGAASGLGTALGEAFLPMHIPVILVGLLAGPYAGMVAGLLGPAVSFLLSGMPGALMLPFMMIELCAYGLVAGLLRNIKMPTVVKVAVVQLAGRAARLAAVMFSVYALGNDSVTAVSVWNSVVTGLFGIVLQLVLLPLIVYRVENIKNNER